MDKGAPRYSGSDDLLASALKAAEAQGCETQLIKLNDLKFRACEGYYSKAAHACTDAVEQVIEEHYAHQIEELKGREPVLAERLAQFRDDELAHQVQAVEEGAREAPGYGALSAVIRAGCKAAIRTAEKI